ncbi:hypothetical protein MNBD_GAMMA16-1515 [hydrothermal vent metagenome]|uniref:Amidohydrolase-related domain-containing protein n=1 Tax=hydrothermal vent metagenome TaxID=652676 RepID=A0A3B0Z0F7_9ZZZZ
MKRRHFLTLGAMSLVGAAGCRFWPDEGFVNPCYVDRLPEALKQHDEVQQAWEGIDATQVWDCHCHLVGVGDNDSGVWVNPKMQSVFNPVQYTQFRFYLNAACANSKNNVDNTYVKRISALLDDFPDGYKAMLLAFDYHHDKQGSREIERSTFYTPNDYAEKTARQNSNQFEWIASIHPLRPDAIEALERAVQRGARAIKWLPQAMRIDPSSAKCDAFYSALIKHNMPLLSHAGHEHAVDAADLQALGNPLLLRRPLEQGVKVIVAHCASTGSSLDLDAGKSATEVSNISLFARMMNEVQYQDVLYGDISALTQVNRSRETIEAIFKHPEWHERLLYGSDYPLPGVMPLFSPETMVAYQFLQPEQAQILSQIRQYNPILFDFLLKRMMSVGGQKLEASVFHTRPHFSQERAKIPQ